MSFILHRTEKPDLAQLGQRLAEDPRQAARWVLAAASAGELEAQALLGQLLLDGLGIQRDAALARDWFEIAARHGHAMASNMLGRCCELGWGGPVDEAAAARHYRTAAEHGLDWGMYNYANLLATGRGVARNEEQAFAWYRRSAEAGDFRGQFSYATVLMSLGRWDEARHWLREALALGHLKFLRKTRDELRQAAIAEVADIAEAYARRCAELEAATS
ncbi:tetratricopeptide repeat protein [Azotobacter salinestris]|uniref:tetratricopeptide repeat protein n=1 Tax=Azotobacter salinestris TaxID=69964 RepID=UPI001266ABE9|nr:tetratricopeptide repeat protein [Azotobacter salinestris]